jgi:RNase adapter protein RapZ
MSPQQHPPFILFGPVASGLSSAEQVFADYGYTVVSHLSVDQLAQQGQDWAKPNTLLVLRPLTLGEQVDHLISLLKTLHGQVPTLQGLQLGAPSEVRMQRLLASERLHPLQSGDQSDVSLALATEADLYARLKGATAYALDTSQLTLPELRNKIAKLLGLPPAQQTMTVTLVSFGFKHGAPRHAELLFDMRFLKNPFYEVPLRPLTGLDAPVKDYVLGLPTAQAFLSQWCALIGLMLPQFVAEGKLRVTIGIGCTGGQHRSVCMTQALAAYLHQQFPSYKVVIQHREQAHWPTKPPVATAATPVSQGVCPV